MRRIRVTDDLKATAQSYESRMQKEQIFVRKLKGKDKNVIVNPLLRLNDLKGTLDDKNKIVKTKKDSAEVSVSDDVRKMLSDYVAFIIEKYPKELLSLTPTGMRTLIKEFSDKDWETVPEMEILLPESKFKKFGTIIYETMQYQLVRQYIMPEYIRKLGIKTCCYCNAEYTITDKSGVGYYQLDHWKPKSLYPYLCISFFNLQPSCAYCNNHKGSDDTLEFLNLYEDQEDEPLDVFEFHINKDSVDDYLTSHQREILHYEWREKSPQYKTLRESMDSKLHISDIYDEHKDEVEELIWRSQFYGGSFLDAINDSKIGIELTEDEIRRFILGTYANADEVHKRPLTKLKQDLAKELGMDLLNT